MANKKISELTTRTPSLSDLMLVGDPSSGYSFKCTVTALATIIETDIADGYVTLGTAQTISGAKTFSNNLTLTSVSNAGVDTDKFLVLSGSNVVNFRTGAEVLSDIGAQAALTNPITGTGTSGQVSYFNGTNSITSSPTFAFTPTSQLLVNNSVTAASAIARGINATPSLTASANNDVLVGLDINPTFTNAAFTGVSNWGIRSQGSIYVPSNINGSGFGITIQNTNSGSSALSGMGFQNDQSQGTSILQYSSTRNNVDNNNQYNCGPATIFDYQGAGSLVFSSSLSSGSNRGIRFFTGASSSNATEKVRIFANGNVTIQNGGTHTDAGFRLDVNGTARVQSNLTVLPSAGGTISLGVAANNAFRYVDGGGVQRIDYSNSTTSWNLYGGSGATNNFRLSANTLFSQTQVLQAELNYFTITREFNGNVNSAGSFRSVLNLTTSIVNPLSNANILRMLYIDPAITGWTTVNSIEVVNGNTLLGTTSGNVAIGGGTSPAAKLEVTGSITAASAIARGVNFTNTLVAAANNDVLVGLDVNPTFTNGAFTNLNNIGLRVFGSTITNNTTPSIEIRQPNATSTTYLSVRNQGSYSTGTIAADFGITGSAGGFFSSTVAGDIVLKGFSQAATSKFFIGTTSSNQLVLFPTNNVAIGTATDAGFRLDVNGTARVQGNFTQTGANTAQLSYINNSSIGVYSNAPGGNIVGMIIGAVSNAGHTAIFTKGNTATSTAIRVTDQNIGASVNHFIVDFAGSSGFGLPNGTTTVAASAQVEIVSTTKGFLPPRMTTAQRDAISTPATGLSVYNTSTNTNDYYSGSAWLNVGQVLVPANNTTGFSISGSSLTGSNAQSLVSLSQTWNTTGNPTAIKLDVTNTASGNNSYLLDLQVGGIPQFTVFKGGEIKTSSPAGGVAQTWKLGSVQAVTPTSPNRTIEVEVNGTTYYLHAKTTND